jgi:hypothetical protein
MDKNMENLIEELRTVIPFKSTTAVGDIVLVIAQNPQMLLYGQVTSIERDRSKRDEWWNIGLTFFTVPLQKVVWTLRTQQMTGSEVFTMGGEKRFFQAVEVTDTEPKDKVEPEGQDPPKRPLIKRIK